MPRLFSGIEIPASLADRLSLLKGKLPGSRWIEPQNYHITLRFLGDVDDVTARAFASALSEIECQPFTLRPAGLGSFGGSRPRSLWIGLEASQELVNLQKAHEYAARLAGLPAEGRNFSPHITLARLSRTRPSALAEYMNYYGGVFCTPFQVEEFVLFSARANQGGGPYLVEATYPLSGFPDFPDETG